MRIVCHKMANSSFPNAYLVLNWKKIAFSLIIYYYLFYFSVKFFATRRFSFTVSWISRKYYVKANSLKFLGEIMIIFHWSVCKFHRYNSKSKCFSFSLSFLFEFIHKFYKLKCDLAVNFPPFLFLHLYMTP